MIQACRSHGQGDHALRLFDEMIRAGIPPSKYTYSNILCVIAERANLVEVQNIYQQLQVL